MILAKIPIPPSINKQLASFNGRLVKTAEARKFSSSIHIYILKNLKLLDQLKETLPQDTALSVNLTFVFHKERLIGKKNQIKTLDVNNYLKSTIDAVAKIINIDDKFYFDHIIKKVTCDKVNDEQVIVEILPTKIERYEDLRF